MKTQSSFQFSQERRQKEKDLEETNHEAEYWPDKNVIWCIVCINKTDFWCVLKRMKVQEKKKLVYILINVELFASPLHLHLLHLHLLNSDFNTYYPYICTIMIKVWITIQYTIGLYRLTNILGSIKHYFIYFYRQYKETSFF